MRTNLFDNDTGRVAICEIGEFLLSSQTRIGAVSIERLSRRLVDRLEL